MTTPTGRTVTEDKGRGKPLGQRGKVEVNQTLLRVVGRETDALDVAAFQSFVN